MPTRPNILFIFTDQQTNHAMSAAGNPHLHTLHMDAIAHGGVRFERSYCASPVCGPSRACLATGRMPHEVGVNTNSDRFNPATPTLGHMLRSAGYTTAYAGLRHILGSRAGDPERDFGFEFLPYPAQPGKHLGAAYDPPVADSAIEFLRRKHDRPFGLVVTLLNPHDICYWIMGNHPPAGDVDRLPPLPRNFPRDPDEPQFVSDCRQRRHYGNEANWTRHWTTDHWRTYLDAYYRLTEQVDVQVGRILTTLREQGLERDTLVVFTADHGEGSAGHQWVVKLMLYEEPATVPLLLRWPAGIPAGVVDRTHLASGVDVVPTICDYAGAAMPPGITGVSLRPVIGRPDLPGRPFIVSELQPDTKDATKLGRMLRTPRWKYVAFSYGRNPEMLFDLDADLGETRNVAHLPEVAATLQEHRELLAKWIAGTGDHFPIAAVRDAVNVRG